MLSCATVHLSWSCYAWQLLCWSWHDSLQTTKTVYLSWSCYRWQSTCHEAALNKNPLVLKLPCMTVQFGFPCTATCDRFNSYINTFCCFFLSACIKERKRWLYVNNNCTQFHTQIIIFVWNCVQLLYFDHGIQVLLSSGIFIAWFYYMFWVWSVPFAIFFIFLL